MNVAGNWAALAALIGFLIGAWAGLSGYSGWPVVVPLLFVLSGQPLHESLAASILVDWMNAVVAAGVYVWRGDADRATAGRWALLALPLVLVGAGLSFALLQRFEDLLRGGAGTIAIVLGGALLIRAARHQPVEVPMGAFAGVRSDPVRQERPYFALRPGTARALFRGGMSLNAFAMGFIGMGGGFSAAILLMLLRGDDTRVSVGTGLLFTALVLPVALLAYLVMLPRGIGIGSALLPFAAVSALGAGLAAWLVGRIPSRQLGFVVGGCVLMAGVMATGQRWTAE